MQGKICKGLQSTFLSESLGEAAHNLGASGRKAFLNITLPLCLPSIAVSFIIVFTYSFEAYELPVLLGPTSPRVLPVQAYIEYIHPELSHRPYAMALNTIMIAICLSVTLLYFRIIRNTSKKTEVHIYD